MIWVVEWNITKPALCLSQLLTTDIYFGDSKAAKRLQFMASLRRHGCGTWQGILDAVKCRSLFSPQPVPLVHQCFPSVSLSGSPTGAPSAGETQRTIPVFKELTVWFGETGGYVCGPGKETTDVRCRCKLGNGSLGWSQGWFLVDWGSKAGEGMGERQVIEKSQALWCGWSRGMPS